MVAVALSIFAAPLLAAHAVACAFRPTTVQTVSVPGRPFGLAATVDGCWLFVALFDTPQGGGGVAVLRNRDGAFRLDHVVNVPGRPSGLSLAESGRLLAVAAEDRILLIDVGRLESGDQQPIIADISDTEGQGPLGAIEAQFALHDRWLFVSEERRGRIAVLDAPRAEAGAGAASIVARAIVGGGPVGLALSPDGLRLFVTSEVAAPSVTAPSRCASLRPGGEPSPQGLLLAIDVRAAAETPDQSIRAGWVAGCSPVRAAVSPDGSQVWVSARGDDAVLAFPTREAPGAHSPTAPIRYKVGASPVGLAVRPDGRELWVADSDRFSPTGAGTLTCIALADGSERRLGAGRFPRELIFLPDGKTLAASLFGSNALLFVPTKAAGDAAATCQAAPVSSR
jgi:DNA-binding beta-propeller fold protein YncE